MKRVHRSGFERARVAALVAGLTAVAGFAAPAAVAQSAAEPIKIGLVFAKQGPFSLLGSTLAQGALFAAEERGMRVMGRELRVIWYDEANPNDAQLNMTKLAQQDRVAAVIGSTSSGVALAMTDVAKREKIPLVISSGAAREVTGAKCNRYTFRVPHPLPIANKALGNYILGQGKNWYFLTANYSFGQDTQKLLRPYVLENGGTVAGQDEVPVGTTDFSSFILKIRQARPSVVVAGLAGADYTNFLKQFAEFGLADKIPVANPYASDDYIWALSPEAAVGLYTKVWHYGDPEKSTEEKAFVEAWMKKYNKPASVEAWEGWISMRFVLAAIEKAGAIDSRSIATALESASIPSGGPVPYTFRAWDHQLIKQVPVVRAHAPQGGDKWRMMDVVAKLPQDPATLDAFFGDKAEVGCTMDDF